MKSLKTSCKDFNKVFNVTGRFMPDVLCLKVHEGRIVEALVHEVLSPTQKLKDVRNKLARMVEELENFIPQVKRSWNDELIKSLST